MSRSPETTSVGARIAPTSPRRSVVARMRSASPSAVRDGLAACEQLVAHRRERRAARLAAVHLEREEALHRQLPRYRELVAESLQRRLAHRMRPIVA
jgi:hypothetical protein